MKDKIIFLDFDGVVNTPIWRNYTESGKEVFKCKYAWPEDGFVNNFQAVCWLNELYRKYPFDIVISSTWRLDCKEYTPAECLYNGGLNKKIEIIDSLGSGYKREELIVEWLKKKDYKGEYVIFDDEDSYYYCTAIEEAPELRKRLVLTDALIGITHRDYHKAEGIFRNWENQKMIDCGMAFPDEFTPYNK